MVGNLQRGGWVAQPLMPLSLHDFTLNRGQQQITRVYANHLVSVLGPFPRLENTEQENTIIINVRLPSSCFGV